MKILKKCTSTMFLLLLTTTIAPLNANLKDNLINKGELRKWCEQYVSKEKLNTIETGLTIGLMLSTVAFLYMIGVAWTKGKEQRFEGALKNPSSELYKLAQESKNKTFQEKCYDRLFTNFF
jgi:hypothetical protein